MRTPSIVMDFFVLAMSIIVIADIWGFIKVSNHDLLSIVAVIAINIYFRREK